MVSHRPWPRVRRLLLAGILGATSMGVLPAPTASAATDRLPDLRAARIRDLRIEMSGSRRLLRFTGILWNRGPGPFEIRASRPNTRTAWDVDQIVYDTAGGSRRLQTAATMRYAGDGHDHWHVRRMLTYHLWGASGTKHDAKIGFCFFDTNLINGDIARSPSRPVYQQTMCGKRGSLKTRNGISVGWGDRYPWDFAYQWVDITGLKAGTYTLRSAVDLYGAFAETSDSNNCAWSRIRIPARGRTVTVLESGYGCINDHATSPYAADVAWAIERGVSRGCDADMFCTNDPLTRAHLATFLARAFALLPATTDAFTDDDGTTRETDIDRVAAAGLMTGCTATTFCPARRATREQVARAIAVAAALAPATLDHFDDDDGRALEPAINAIAEARIMGPCAERAFCPTASVTRGQMARHLHLALTLLEAPPEDPPESPAP